MNVRKLLARLNPATLNLSGSGGGGPDIAPDDIAGALGFVEAGIGRELLCHLWWPLGATLSAEHLQREIFLIQHEEFARLERLMVVARLELHLVETNYQARLLRTRHDEAEIRRCQAARDQARGACWPHQPLVYARITAAVLNEMAGTTLCKQCRGDGCAACDMTGAIAISARQRADAIGRDEAAYRQRWGKVYEFTYRRLRDAEQQAARALRRALREDWEQAA